MLSEQVVEKPTPEAEAITTAPVEKLDVTTDAASETQHDEPQKMVPLAALHEERQTRKQMQADLRAMREEQARQASLQQQQAQEYALAQQRLQQIIAAQTQVPPPSKADDPIGYTTHIVEQTQAQVQALGQQQAMRQQQEMQQQQQWQQQQAVERQKQALVQLTTQSESEFVKQQPDYMEAVSYAKTRRVKELMAAGYDQDYAVNFAQNEGWQLAHTWLSQGMNPAERAYALAKAMGYQGQTVDPEMKLEMAEAGQKASKASGSSGNGRSRLSPQQVAAMSPTQLARLSDEDFRAIMGG